jgi:hypothetical protein
LTSSLNNHKSDRFKNFSSYLFPKRQSFTIHKKTSMKKLFLVTCFLLMAGLSKAQWEPDVRLTNDPDSSVTSYNQAWCIASSGDFVHVVWYDNRDGNWEIYYKRSTDGGISWESDERLTNDPAISGSPALAVSGYILHVVWRDERDGNREIYYKRSTDGGLTWSADIRLTADPAVSSVPSIAVSGSHVHLIWRDDRDGNTEIYYKRSTDDGLTWKPDQRLTNDVNQSYNPSLATSGSDVHVVWNDDREGYLKIYYKNSSDGGITWGEDTKLIDTYLAQLPTVAASGSKIYVAWNELVGTGDFDLYYKRSTDGGQSWEEGQWLTAISGTSKCINLSVSGSIVHAVWEDDREGEYGIYYKRSDDEGINWSLDTLLSDNASGRSEHPSVATAGSTVHVLWYDDRDENFEVYYKRNPTGGFPVGTNNELTVNTDNTPGIYPNPASTFIHFKFINELNASSGNSEKGIIFTIRNIFGQEVLSKQIQNNESFVDVSGLQNGIYFAGVKTGDKQTISRKLIILR